MKKLLHLLVFLFVCSQINQLSARGIDLAIAVNGSESIDAADFALQKDGIKQSLANPLVIPRDGSLAFTLVQYADDITQVHVPYNSVIQQIPFTPTFGSEGSPIEFFITPVLYSPDIKVAQIVFDNQTLVQEIASDNAPQVTVIFPNGGESLNLDIITFEWIADDLDADDLTYIVQYSMDGGSTFETFAIDWTETTFDIPLTELGETSQGVIKIIASDGFNSSSDISDSFFITSNNAPISNIQNPVNNTTYIGVEPIFFDASAFDLEDGQLTGSNLVWTSSLDGFIENGTSFNLIGTDLQEGNHVITLTATDNSGASVITSVNIVVSYLANTAPLVEITSPMDSAVFNLNDSLNVEVFAEDIDASDTIDYVLILIDSDTVATLNQAPYNYSTILTDIGNFTLTAIAVDSNGAMSTSSIVYSVINACSVDGGTISTSDPTTVCADDGTDDLINVTLTDNTGTNSQWVITDTTGVILDLPAAPPFNFENANEGICLIWHLSYEDGLTGVAVGNSATMDLVGCYDLSNPIEVIRNEVSGGTLSINGNTGEIMTSICIDGIPDSIDVQINGAISGSNFAWVITDSSLNILALPLTPPFELDGAGVGTCLIWYLAYEDGLTGAVVGENAVNLSGCFDLSNSITVVRTCCDDSGNPSDCESDCETYTLDFEESGNHWTYNSTSGSFTDSEQTFDIDIDNDDHILENTYESGSGLTVGIDPYNVHDEVVITYNLSEVASRVVFDIVDLDYKTGGSRQQEAVCVYGLLGNSNTQILPTITSLEGNVAIDGNCAEATTNSAISGEDESILVEFDECIDQIVIVYGTGSNSPTHYPDYSKITIGADGFITEVCGDECVVEEVCEDYTLDFEEHGVLWHHYATSGSYDLGNETVDIDIEDNDHILRYTGEDNLGVKIAINPRDVHDEVVITYDLSEVSGHVVFDIADLDYKTGSSRQQEAVCVYGLLGNDDTQILPTITSAEGSVAISGNCAEATANSSISGEDESILVEFTQCIDQIVIVYGTGSNSPTHNPSYSSITVGERIGFTAEFCPDPCEDNSGSQPKEDLSNANISIFPNPADNASLVTISIESETKGDAELLITDALGRYIAQMPIELNGNITNYRFDTNRLNSGIYLVQISTYKWQSRTQRMVIINR